MPRPPANLPANPFRPAHVAAHLGELLQGRLGESGPIALITLPCPTLGVTVTRQPAAFALHQPDVPALSRHRARQLLDLLRLPLTGRFVVRTNVPLGGGAGASTAALVALAQAAGQAAEHRSPDQIAAACLAVEGASDPLMFPKPEHLLWASRKGRVLAPLPALPRMEVLGGFYGPPQRTDPRDSLFPDIEDLVGAWAEACRDPRAIGRLASQSARRTLALRGPALDPIEALAARCHALGFAIGHTGPARALLFQPGSIPDGAEPLLRSAGWSRITRFRIGGTHA